MKLKILTQDEVVLDTDVASVTLPGTLGEMTILPRHTAMLATLKKGKVRYRNKAGILQAGASIEGGFVEVHKDHVLVLTKISGESSQIPEAGPSRH